MIIPAELSNLVARLNALRLYPRTGQVTANIEWSDLYQADLIVVRNPVLSPLVCKIGSPIYMGESITQAMAETRKHIRRYERQYALGRSTSQRRAALAYRQHCNQKGLYLMTQPHDELTNIEHDLLDALRD